MGNKTASLRLTTEVLGNYKTVIGKEEDLQKLIDGDLEGCRVSGPCPESELRAKYRKLPINSLGGENKDLTRPDGGTLVDAHQGRVIQHTRLTMQLTGPSLSDAMRIIGGLGNQVGAKFDGGQSHRRAIAPEEERGLVATLVRNCLFYANAVGTFGVASAGGNRDRLASAAHRWAMEIVDKTTFPRYYPQKAPLS